MVWNHSGRSRLALLSFSAPALKCSARDEWIGWSCCHQYDRLNLVANNSRFLIRRRDPRPRSFTGRNTPVTIRSSPSRYSTLPHVSLHRVSFKRITAEGRLLRSFHIGGAR
ncbi:Druantia anti-phage system protein DruA [Nitrosomonas sp.]|uniref:Druantia anti-phage system protein DruA n=1 Tax=Nitrosomonas sp. TaxID=42353 RepID=UPI0035205F65